MSYAALRMFYLLDILIMFICFLVKPKEFETEELDPSDPASMYFIYICRKSKELVTKKKVKLGRLKKKALKAFETKGRKVNLKPSLG